jgi:hypothetical protein
MRWLDERLSAKACPAVVARNAYSKACDLASMLSSVGRLSSLEVSIYTYPGDPLGIDAEHRPQTSTEVTPKPEDERPAGGFSQVTGAPALDLSSRLHGGVRTADRAALTFVRDHAVSSRRAAPMPTATTLRITGQVRPGQDAPTEIALDHEVTLVPIAVAPADGFDRACNLEVDDTAIGWVAYGRARGSYGWVWGDQLASHGSFQLVAASRSAAVFCELLAAVRAGSVADARTAPGDDPAGAGVLGRGGLVAR